MRDLIHWQYAKIIADSAGMGKRNYGFVMSKFKKLQGKEIFWDEIREYVKERERSDECVLCGAKERLTMDHLFPRSMKGPDTEKNIVWICRSCNSAKGARRPYELYTLSGGLKAAKYDVPRIAEGKYLKLLYEVFDEHGILDLEGEELRAKACPRCDMRALCEKEKSVEKLTPLCLDGLARTCYAT